MKTIPTSVRRVIEALMTSHDVVAGKSSERRTGERRI
jgi:hypothetical protein